MTRNARDRDLHAAYATLGVSPSDDFAAIRAAYRALARANHPDLASGDREAATRRLAEINDAYDALRHHKKQPCLASVVAEAAEAAEEERRREAARRAAAAKIAARREEDRRERERREAAQREEERRDALRRAEERRRGAAAEERRRAEAQTRATRAAGDPHLSLAERTSAAAMAAYLSLQSLQRPPRPRVRVRA